MKNILTFLTESLNTQFQIMSGFGFTEKKKTKNIKLFRQTVIKTNPYNQLNENHVHFHEIKTSVILVSKSVILQESGDLTEITSSQTQKGFLAQQGPFCCEETVFTNGPLCHPLFSHEINKSI